MPESVEKSGKDVHCMHDHPHHGTHPIFGGMWGIKGGVLSDELLELAMKTLDVNKRKEYFDEMQKILHDDVTVIPLYSPMLFFIQNPRIERPEFFPHGKDWHVNYQWEKWTIKE